MCNGFEGNSLAWGWPTSGTGTPRTAYLSTGQRNAPKPGGPPGDQLTSFFTSFPLALALLLLVEAGELV